MQLDPENMNLSDLYDLLCGENERIIKTPATKKCGWI